jgi:Tol biopolymer transport system component
MIGQVIGHYEILGLIGQGGMGSVYRAHDSRLDRDVALKVLPGELAENPDFRQRFDREVKSLAALRHPNIVTIYSFEEIDDIAFYTMELVEGKTLDSVLTAKGLSLDRFFRIAPAIAAAVGHAHQKGITHRDLKPANVMVDRDGSPKVLDFGLAKLAAAGLANDAQTVTLDELQTQEGRILGTAAYMSPEQAEGKPVDQRSDLFALGIILFEMATGRKPFVGDSPMSTISAIIKDTPATVTSLNDRLPRHLGRIVKKCLEKEPDRRYQSAFDLRNDLEVLKSEIDSGEVAADFSVYRPQAGKPWWGWLGVAVAVVAASWLISNLMTRDHLEEVAAPGRLSGAVNLTRSGKVEAADLSPDGRYLAYSERRGDRSNLRVLQLATRSDVEILAPLPGEITQVRFGPEGELVYFLDEENRALYRVPLLGGDSQLVLTEVDNFAVHPDGKRLVFLRFGAGGNDELWLGDIDHSETKELAVEIVTGFRAHLAWSHDGERFFFNTLKEKGIGEWLMQASPADPSPVKIGHQDWTFFDGLHSLRDGSGLVFAGPRTRGGSQIQMNSELWIQTSLTLPPVRLTHDPFEYSSIGSDRYGNRLTAVQQQTEQSVQVMALDDALRPRQVMYASRSGRWWMPPDWTRDNRIVYPALVGDEVHLWEVGSDGTGRRRLTNTGSFNVSCSVSPDGRTLAYASNRDGSLKIYLKDMAGGTPRRLTTGDWDEFVPDFSPDGQWVVYTAFKSKTSEIRKTSLADGRTVVLDRQVSFLPSFSPDGLSVIISVVDTLSLESSLCVISAQDGSIQRSLPCDPCTYGRARMSADGEALIYGRRRDDADNLWLQPLDGSEPRQLTYFTTGTLAGFDLSAAGDSLVVSTIEHMQDVVMFEDYRGQIQRAAGLAAAAR